MRPWIPCALLCALVVALSPQSPAQDRRAPQQQQARPYAGQLWDYRVFRLDEREYKDKLDYQQILREEGSRGAEAVFFQRVLHYLGEEGWELVTFERRGAEVVYLYLKRPRPR
ncbi:MAG: hypothetical protein AB7N76_00430 [Planctomycetota bacterium]